MAVHPSAASCRSRPAGSLNGVMRIAYPTFNGTEIPSSKSTNRRSELARLMAEGDRPQLAAAFVNRLWAQLFGYGFTTPLDDMGPHNPPTHPEVLELRYPVVLERFEIARGSGGKGEWYAGDGTLRVIRFLEEMQCAILSGFRKVRPFGSKGGEPGQAGENWVRRSSGHLERLKGADQTVLEPGEAIVIKTPTGGGYGMKDPKKGRD